MKNYKMLLLVAALFFGVALASYSQAPVAEGMNFEHLPNWNDVLAKAKKEKKMIFLDCYTTWCGPCKQMSSQVFTQKEVGEFYNANFINTKVQLDTTDNDNGYIKGWYKDGHDLAKKYKVRAFPTYLIFNSDGEIIHRFVGSMPGAEFISAGKDLLNTDNQYYAQLKMYEAGDKSPKLLYRLAKLSEKAYESAANKKFIEEYLATQTDIYTKENLQLLYGATRSSEDRGFKIALNEAAKADEILEKQGTSKRLVKNIILNEELNSLFRQGGTPDFDTFDKKLNEKYPQYAKWVSDYAKMYYSMNKKNLPDFVKYADEVVKADDVQAGTLNQFAWTVFENTEDKALLEKAIEWSKASLKLDDNPTYIDTHANLLYRAGKVAEGIAEEKRALEIAKKTDGDVKWCEDIIAKMEKGEPTWPVKENQ